MEDPVISRRKPYLVQVEQGKSYFWCACGRSKSQPFCDGSHKDTEFQPLKWVAEETADQGRCCSSTGCDLRGFFPQQFERQIDVIEMRIVPEHRHPQTEFPFDHRR